MRAFGRRGAGFFQPSASRRLVGRRPPKNSELSAGNFGVRSFLLLGVDQGSAGFGPFFCDTALLGSGVIVVDP